MKINLKFLLISVNFFIFSLPNIIFRSMEHFLFIMPALLSKKKKNPLLNNTQLSDTFAESFYMHNHVIRYSYWNDLESNSFSFSNKCIPSWNIIDFCLITFSNYIGHFPKDLLPYRKKRNSFNFIVSE